MAIFGFFKKETKIILALVFFHLLSRLFHLTLLPIFTDESIYLYWAKFIASYHSNWFISLTDGKPPLLIWILAIFLKVFPTDSYLFAGRLTAVIFGCLSLIGTYHLTKMLFQSARTALIAAFLYICSPFLLFYERLVLFDSLLCLTLIWSLIYALKTAQSATVKNAIFWGIILGLAFLSKPTAIIFWLLTPLAYFLFLPEKNNKNLFRKLFLVFLALLISQIINNLQRLSSVYYLSVLKNQQFQQPLKEIISHPLSIIIVNLLGFFNSIIAYYTQIFFLFGLFAFVVLLSKKLKKGLILLLAWFGPIFGLALIGKEVFPRYILFTTPYFIIACAFLLDLFLKTKMKVGFLFYIGLFLLVFGEFISDYRILFNPPLASLPAIDYHQYISEHPSGYGLNQIFTFLDDQLRTNKVTLVTQGTFGLCPYAFELRYWDHPNLKILSRWPLASFDQEIVEAAKDSLVFLLFREGYNFSSDQRLKLVLIADKPGGKDSLLLTSFSD